METIKDKKTKIMNKLRELKSSKSSIRFNNFKYINSNIIENCFTYKVN